MANVQTNTVKPGFSSSFGSNPFNSAIQGKINPPALQPIPKPTKMSMASSANITGIQPFNPSSVNLRSGGTLSGTQTGTQNTRGMINTGTSNTNPSTASPTVASFIGGANTKLPSDTPPPPLNYIPNAGADIPPPPQNPDRSNTIPVNSGTNPYINSVNTQENYATGQGNPAVNTATGGLQGIAQNQTPAVTEAYKRMTDFQKQDPFLMAAAMSNPNLTAQLASGQGQILGNQLAGEEQGLSNSYNAAITGQGQQINAGTAAGQMAQAQQGAQIGAAQNVGGLTQPQAGASFYGSPVTGNVVGTGGVGGTGNQLIDTNVQQALDMVKNNNASVNDPQVQKLLSISPLAQQAFNRVMQSGGGYNPTAQSASVQQNMTQGQQYQGKAADLNTNLTQMRKVTAPILDLMNRSGLNQQDNPFFNASINEYSSQLHDPSAQAALKSGMAEIKTYVSNILGTGGDLTPTAVTEMVNSFDAGNFTASQLNSFLQNLDNYGQARLQGFQQTSSGSYGGSRGYTGSQANPSAQATIPTPNPPTSITTNNPVKQGLIGGALRALGGIEGLITGIASKILR